MPVEELNGLLDDLRALRILKQENVRLAPKGFNGYCWTPPYNARSIVPLCKRELVVHGNGPDVSSFLSNSAWRKIDTELRSCTPGFNGFDGLCAFLLLPARRNNLKSSFRLSAELPGEFWSVKLYPRRRAIDLEISCFGAPDIMVEWLPFHQFQKIPTEWMTSAENGVPSSASIPIPDEFVTAAKLSLAFGELDADAVLVDLADHWGLESQNRQYRKVKARTASVMTVLTEGINRLIDRIAEPGPIFLKLERENLDSFSFLSEEAPNQQQPADSASREAPNQESEGRKRPFHYRSEIKDAILTALTREPSATDEEICEYLDDKGLAEIPASWQKGKNRLFAKAYKDPELRHKIEV
jgi:hypothetical protein